MGCLLFKAESDGPAQGIPDLPSEGMSVGYVSPVLMEPIVNIFVGNLPYSTTEADLRATFEAHGEVSSTSIIMDKMTGRSRGFGFVEMPNSDQATAAINALNNADFNGRPLTVNEARPRTDGPRAGGGGGGRGGFGGRRDRY